MCVRVCVCVCALSAFCGRRLFRMRRCESVTKFAVFNAFLAQLNHQIKRSAVLFHARTYRFVSAYVRASLRRCVLRNCSSISVTASSCVSWSEFWRFRKQLWKRKDKRTKIHTNTYTCMNSLTALHAHIYKSINYITHTQKNTQTRLKDFINRN